MIRLPTSTILLAAVLLASPAAFGQAQLYITQAPIPARLSEQGLRNFMRSHQARQVNEENDHQTWKFKVGSFFRGPPGDLEAHLLFYDVEHGSRLFVTEMAVFLSSREETAFLQNVTLNRPQFKPRNRYIAVLTVRRNEMASANFELVGRPVERSGLVEFTDEETQDPDQVSAQQQQAAAEAQRVAIAREQARQREYEQAMAEAHANQAASANAGGDSGGGGGGGGAIEDTEGGEEGVEGEEVVLAGTNSNQSQGGCASCAAGPASPVGEGASGGAVVAVAAIAGLCARTRRRR